MNGAYPICVDGAVQPSSVPNNRDDSACDGCRIVVNALAILTRFRTELGYLEGHDSCVRDVTPVGQQRIRRGSWSGISSNETCW